MSLTVPIPTTLHGDVLTDELHAAGFTDAAVSADGRGGLVITGVDEDDRAAVEQVVANHQPPALEPDPDDALRDAISKATTLDDLKAALLGTNADAAVAGKPTRT